MRFQQIKKAQDFIKTGIWQIPIERLPKKIALLIAQLRVVLVAIRGFREDKCMEKASSLTFYSLLSIVPIFAMMFGIAKGFGFEKKLEIRLYETLSDKKDILDQIFNFTNKLLENTQGGVIAGAGLILLLWSVMKLLGNIEASLNEIWEVNTSRSIVRKITDYFSLMLLAPILLVVSSSATKLVEIQVQNIASEIEWMQYFEGIISALLKLLPLSLVWFVFAFVYMIMPNTKVHFRSAFVGGIIGGIIFQVVQIVYVEFQVGVAKYNAIYGSFAALPLFLMWLQTSWIIVMLGAEISFASQNANKYEFELETQSISHNFRIKLSVFITHTIVARFNNEERALTPSELASLLNLPNRVVNSIINELVEAGVLIFVATLDEKIHAVQPAITLDKLSIYKVIEKLNRKGTNQLAILRSRSYHDLELKIDHLYNNFGAQKENILLKDLVLVNETSIIQKEGD